MRYQHPGFAAFIKAFLFRHALSLGNGFMAAFNPLTACTITYCAIMVRILHFNTFSFNRLTCPTVMV